MRWASRIALAAFVLPLGFTAAAFSAEGQAPVISRRCPADAEKIPVEYNLPVMREALAELTNWDVKDWPAPQILELPPEAFEGRAELDRHRFVGSYEPEKNRVFVNLTCRCQVPDHPEAFCRAVLFHELVHWGQHQLGADKVMSWRDQEHQALEYETQYLEIKLGISDVYPPPRPTPAELPALTRPFRLNRMLPRTLVQDAAGERQALWIMTGTWHELPSRNEFRSQVIAHRGHWVGVEIFKFDPANETEELVEAWWDMGYVRRNPTFPAYPIYRGQWVKVK
jgi:hypothetical protein